MSNPCAPDSPWTPAATEYAKGLWVEGLSGAAIGRMMGANGYGTFSRSAVISKAARDHWPARLPTSSKPPPTPRALKERARANAPAPSRCEPAPPQQIALTPLADDDGAPLAGSAAALKRGQCKWPIGDPLRPGFAFCCRPTDTEVARDPYCAAHKAIARVRGTALNAQAPKRKRAA